jgi:hypothetical protein
MITNLKEQHRRGLRAVLDGFEQALAQTGGSMCSAAWAF